MEWVTILRAVGQYRENSYTTLPFASDIKYSHIFNDSTLKVMNSTEFSQELDNYIDSLNEVLTNSTLFKETFTDYHVADLTKSLSRNNLFGAHHSITLENGNQITSLVQWKEYVTEQTERIYADPAVVTHFQALQNPFGSNKDTQQFRNLLRQYRDLITLLTDRAALKKNFWTTYLDNFDTPFTNLLSTFTQYEEDLERLYSVAGNQRPRWVNVIEEFNRRFHVSFGVGLDNQPQVILQSAPAILEFTYFRHRNTPQGIYSPIAQNQRHLELLRQKRSESKGPVSSFFFEKYFCSFNRAIVVLANPKTVLNDRYAPKAIKRQLIKADQLVRHMKDTNAACEAGSYSDKEMEQLANVFLQMHEERRIGFTARYQDVSAEGAKDEGKACPRCGKGLVSRKGQYGAFLGCEGFPRCTYTAKLTGNWR